LAEVQQRVQGEAQQEIQATIQNRVQNHEQVVTRLQEQNQLEQVPEEAPVPDIMSGQMGQNGSTGGKQQGH